MKDNILLAISITFILMAYYIHPAFNLLVAWSMTVQYHRMMLSRRIWKLKQKRL